MPNYAIFYANIMPILCQFICQKTRILPLTCTLYGPFLVQKFNRKKCDHRNIKDDEKIRFSFVVDNTKFFKANEEASEAFAAQQDVTNFFQERETYTVKEKNLALVFEISKRDLKNANCGAFLIEFEDSATAFRSNEFMLCKNLKFII